MAGIGDRLNTIFGTTDDGDTRTVMTDQEQARIERAEIEAKREAIRQYADERREEATQEELERLRDGDDPNDTPGFVEWVFGGLVGAFKEFDQQMVEAHGNSDDDRERERTDGDGGRSSSFEVLDSDRQPQMPDPLGDRNDDNDGPRLP